MTIPDPSALAGAAAPLPGTASKLLARSLRRHRARVLGAVVGFCGHQTCETLVPVAIGLVIDRAVVTADVSNLLIGVVGILVLFNVLMFSWRLGGVLSFGAMQRETHTLRVELASRVLDPRGARTGKPMGEVLSVATSDAMRTATILRVGPSFVAACCALVVAAGVLLSIDVALGVVVLVGAPALVALVQVMGPWLTHRNVVQQEATGATTALATDLVRGGRALRGVGAEANAVERYRLSSQRTLLATIAAARTGGVYQAATTLASGLFLAIVAGLSGWFAINGRISVGELITIVGLAQFLGEPVRGLGELGQALAIARSSAGRVVSVLTAPSVNDGGAQHVVGTGGLRVERASYRGLHDIDLSIAPGELVGILAYQPADADALLDLLAGRVSSEDHTGRVLVDGIPLDEADLGDARAAVLVEQHDVALFAGSIRSNVLAGVTGTPSEAELTEALLACAGDDVVGAHPDGLERDITDRGRSLSGGQRQRLGLVRALLARPPVLVLHDPTTAVDAVTEETIAAGLVRFRHGPGESGGATVVVTSSPAILGLADRVLVVDGGRVIRESTHADLAHDDERYREQVLR
jgi:putative ABC transport system ATP-binding protein